jgi:hypothetical protein
MCHITYIPEIGNKGILNEWKIIEFLEDTFDSNPDGCGVSFFNKDNNKPTLIKSKNSMTDLIKLAKRYKTTNGWLFHTRIASRGEVSLVNNHPFWIGGNANAFLVHNGTLRCATMHSNRSDTNILTKHLRDYSSNVGVEVMLDELFKIEGYTGSTILIQYIDRVCVWNYYRFSEVDFNIKDNTYKIFTSSGYYSGDSEKKIRKGFNVISPEIDRDIKYEINSYDVHDDYFSYCNDTKYYHSDDTTKTSVDDKVDKILNETIDRSKLIKNSNIEGIDTKDEETNTVITTAEGQLREYDTEANIPQGYAETLPY